MQDHSDDDNKKIYVKDVYPNLVTLLVMKSAGYDIKTYNGQVSPIATFLNKFWFAELSQQAKKAQARQWLKPCRILEAGKIESRDEDGNWNATGSTLVLKQQNK